MPGVTHHTFAKGAWHDIVRPTLNDLQILVQHYGLSKTLIEPLLLPTLRPRVERCGEALFVAIHFPAYKPDLKRVVPLEIDFAVTKKALITVHYEPLPFLEEFMKAFGDGDKAAAGLTPLAILSRMLEKLTEFEFRQLDHIEQDIENIEQMKFHGKETDVIDQISVVRRNIIHFRRTLKPQKFVFEALLKQAAAVLGPKAASALESISQDYRRVWEQLETHHQTAGALQDTHYAFLSIRTNQIMRLLTLITALFVIPLTALLVVFDIFAMYPNLSLITRWAIIAEIILLEFIAVLILRLRRII